MKPLTPQVSQVPQVPQVGLPVNPLDPLVYQVVTDASRRLADAHQLSSASNLGKSRPDIRSVLEKYEMDPDFAGDLPIISEYHLSFIVDDSGSMSTLTKARESRWQELGRTFNDFITLASLFAKGADVDFLNSGSFMDIPPDRLRALFAEREPSSGTALCTTLTKVLNRAKTRYRNGGGRTCIIIGTDGEPSDGTVTDLLNIINDRSLRDPAVMPIMFLACSDDEHSIGYLNEIDRLAQSVDVCDDFTSEKNEIYAASGRIITYGDYLVKCLLGSIVPRYDAFDEGPGRICVVCGKNLQVMSLFPVVHYSKHGVKCLTCKSSKPTRSPPYCRCAQCGAVDSSRIYIKIDNRWYCNKCKKTPSRCPIQ